MYSITANGIQLKIGQPIQPNVASLEVFYQPGIRVASRDVPRVREWLTVLYDRIDCGYITVNGTLVPTSDLSRPKL